MALRIIHYVLNFVDIVKDLGFIFNFNLKENDISRERNKFYASFNTILRNFFSVLFYLFKIHCLHFYGARLCLIKKYN